MIMRLLLACLLRFCVSMFHFAHPTSLINDKIAIKQELINFYQIE